MARPKKEINWKMVEGKMAAGCSAAEIYNDPDCLMNEDTFYDRFKQEYGKSFSEYSGKFHSIGQGNIRYTQYAKALQGNTTMLLLLGRLWLGQKEQDSVTEISDEAFMNTHKALIEQLKQSQSDRKISDNNNINDK
jgi:hypothetical protein